jgi:hypothetical protein
MAKQAEATQGYSSGFIAAHLSLLLVYHLHSASNLRKEGRKGAGKIVDSNITVSCSGKPHAEAFPVVVPTATSTLTVSNSSSSRSLPLAASSSLAPGFSYAAHTIERCRGRAVKRRAEALGRLWKHAWRTDKALTETGAARRAISVF